MGKATQKDVWENLGYGKVHDLGEKLNNIASVNHKSKVPTSTFGKRKHTKNERGLADFMTDTTKLITF